MEPLDFSALLALNRAPDSGSVLVEGRMLEVDGSRPKPTSGTLRGFRRTASSGSPWLRNRRIASRVAARREDLSG